MTYYRSRCRNDRVPRLVVERLEDRRMLSWLTVIAHGQAESASETWVRATARAIDEAVDSENCRLANVAPTVTLHSNDSEDQVSMQAQTAIESLQQTSQSRTCWQAWLKSAGGTIEKAQQIAAHESPRTTKLYDRTKDELTLDEIEKIQI